MKTRYLCTMVLLAMPAVASAQTGYSITGGLSNFDCKNRCDDPCDEFEIEIEDLQPQDVIHTYHNANYGTPTVTLSADGLRTIIDYRNPQHPTAVDSIEHFGISLRQLNSYNAIRVRWMRNGQPATVNGQVPVAGGGTAPATQPMLPSISADMATGSSGGDGISLTVTNNDPALGIWIKRRAQVTQGMVALESLMRNDPVVTTTVPIDAAPVYLGPGQTLTTTSDLVEVEDDESVVFSAQYFQDLTENGPFNNTHMVGPELGNVMTATIASPRGSCDYYAPVIIRQPRDVTKDAGKSVDVSVDADGNDMPLSYQWLKEGVPLTEGGLFHDVTSDGLSIDELNSSTEGFYSVRVSNECGQVTSRSALVFITGHNVPPSRPPVCLNITQQPQTATACGSGIAQFAVSVEGDGLLYQWQVADAGAPSGWSDIVEGLNIPDGEIAFVATGATLETLAVEVVGTQARDSGYPQEDIRCRISSSCDNQTTRPATLRVVMPVAADFDQDCDVDVDDYALFELCASGPSMAVAPGCEAGDLDGDGDVDQSDFGAFQRCWSGAGNRPDKSCAE